LIEDLVTLREAELAGLTKLLALVSEGNRAEVDQDPSVGSNAGADWRARRVGLAVRALERLRCSDQAGIIETLKELAASLQPIAGETQPQSTRAGGLDLDLSLAPHPPRLRAPSPVGRSTVWRHLVALIGDLGDRDFEAVQMLSEAGEESWWVQVRHREDLAIASGILRQSDRVTSKP
jgi:hypothetical protein